MSRPPDDRGGELRALFFESANEILQSLNEAGLELEARPSDEEVIRRIRRAIHTLKGDSAACGFHRLSELAHELEDVLTPQVAQARGADLAELVLTAADSFGAMLTCYQRRKEPPAVDALHAMIRKLLEAPASRKAAVSAEPQLPAQFAWTEYEQLMISEAVHRGEIVYNVALRIDPNSLMRAAAFQLIRNVLHGSGTVIALRPEDNVAAATVEIVEAALASFQSEERLLQRCRIPRSLPMCVSNALQTRKPPNMNCSVTYWRRRRQNWPPGLPIRTKARWQAVPVLRVLLQLPLRKARCALMPPASMPS